MRQELSTSLGATGITKIRAHEARAKHKRKHEGIAKIRAHEARVEHKPDFGDAPANGL
jgi:hypothetical protein